MSERIAEMSADNSPAQRDAKRLLDAFLDRAKVASRIVLVWTGALFVTWLTGLEPTRRDIIGHVKSLDAMNRVEQALETDFVADQGKLRDELARATSISRLEAVYKAAEAQAAAASRQPSNDSGAIVEGLHVLRRFRNLSSGSSESKKSAPSDLRKTFKEELAAAKGSLAESVQTQAEIEAAIGGLRARLEQRIATAAAKREELRQESAKAKANRKVTFDLLGQKFDLPPAYAASAWLLAILTMILYMRAERHRLLRMYALGDDGWSVAEHRLAADAMPVWCAPVMAGSVSTSGDAGPGPRWQFPGFAGSCLAAFLAAAWVARTGMLTVKYGGDKPAQWLTVSGAITILALMALITLLGCWEAGGRYSQVDTGESNRVPRIIALVAVLMGFGLIALRYPRYSALVGEVTGWAVGVGIAMATIVCIRSGATLALRAPLRAGSTFSLPVKGRRRVLLGVAALAIGTAVAHGRMSKRRPRFRRKKHPSVAFGLPTGLYIHGSSNLVHFIDESGRLACKSDLMKDSLTPAGNNVWKEHLAVHGRCGRRAFEAAFLSTCRVRGCGTGRMARADELRLLYEGVRQEANRLRLTGAEVGTFPGDRTRPPNMRLFDLAAGVAVRSRAWGQFAKVVAPTREASDDSLHFRFAKWTGAENEWYRRWSRRRHLVWNRTRISQYAGRRF